MSEKLYLITEYCGSEIYMGWHLYLRDNKNRQQRNADGGWGWIHGVGRRGWETTQAKKIFDQLGITITGDGSCDHDGLAELARRFPIPRQRIWKKPRGCVEVISDEWGRLALADPVFAGL